MFQAEILLLICWCYCIQRIGGLYCGQAQRIFEFINNSSTSYWYSQFPSDAITINNYNIISSWKISMCASCRCLLRTSIIKNNPQYSRVLFRANWYFPFSQYQYQRRRSFKWFPLNDKQFSIDAFFPISIDGGGFQGLSLQSSLTACAFLTYHGSQCIALIHLSHHWVQRWWMRTTQCTYEDDLFRWCIECIEQD